MLAVTTMSPKAQQTYGLKMMEGLVKHFPGKIVAYLEDSPPDLEGVEFRDFHSIKDADRFLKRIESVFGANGIGHDNYDYRFDCNRFCRKVFAQEAVFDEDEYVFWFDSDCRIFRDFQPEFLRSLFNGKALAFLGRKSTPGLNCYTETGFVGFHTKHPEFQMFRANYLPYFTTGRIFSQLKGWHDCIAFDYARQGTGNNLTPDGAGMNHVLRISVLRDYMEHLKGELKNDLGRVPEAQPQAA